MRPLEIQSTEVWQKHQGNSMVEKVYSINGDGTMYKYKKKWGMILNTINKKLEMDRRYKWEKKGSYEILKVIEFLYIPYIRVRKFPSLCIVCSKILP